MSVKSKKLIRKLFSLYPTSIAKKYHDYVGKMLPCLREEVNKIIVCLDVTKKVVDAALANNVDLIISHHPFIYGKKKDVLLDPYKADLYSRLLSHNICVYSFHTNFDEGKNGMNDALLGALGLENIHPLESIPMARIGMLPEEVDINVFAKNAVKSLKLNYGQLLPYGKNKIKTVAIIGGAGARECFLAYKEGADLFISGDTPYHIRREIIDKGYNYLHLDHEIEKIFIPTFTKILSKIDSSLEITPIDDVVQMELITL